MILKLESTYWHLSAHEQRVCAVTLHFNDGKSTAPNYSHPPFPQSQRPVSLAASNRANTREDIRRFLFWPPTCCMLARGTLSHVILPEVGKRKGHFNGNGKKSETKSCARPHGDVARQQATCPSCRVRRRRRKHRCDRRGHEKSTSHMESSCPSTTTTLILLRWRLGRELDGNEEERCEQLELQHRI